MVKNRLEKLFHLKKKLSNKIIYTSFRIFDAVYYNKRRIFQRNIVQSNDGRKISVILTYFNRDNTIHKALYNIVQDNRIDEILIVDDCSIDSSYEYLTRFVHKLNSSKIKIAKNRKNLGMYPNKIHSISLAKNDWVILLDSDNTITKKYIDALYAFSIWDSKTMYCPSFGFPLLNNRFITGVYDFSTMSQLLAIKQNDIDMFLNSGNFFVNKIEFELKINNFKESCPKAADSAFINYIWLQQGNSINIVKNCVYIHRLNSDSTWKIQQEESILKFNLIKQAFVNQNTKLNFIEN